MSLPYGTAGARILMYSLVAEKPVSGQGIWGERPRMWEVLRHILGRFRVHDPTRSDCALNSRLRFRASVSVQHTLLFYLYFYSAAPHLVSNITTC